MTISHHSRGRAARVVVPRDELPPPGGEALRCGLDTADGVLCALARPRRPASPARSSSSSPYQRRSSGSGGSGRPSGPARSPRPARGGKPAKSSRGTQSAASTRSADRELEAWFEKAAAASPPPTETSFGKLGLPQPLVTALERARSRTRSRSRPPRLPDALAGHDVLGRAQTGSGKTLAFGLPMLARLPRHAGRSRAPPRV